MNEMISAVAAKRLPKLIALGVVVLLVIVFAFASFSVVSPTERGVKVTLGKASDRVLEPGLVFKAPFIQKVKKYDLSPKNGNLKFSLGSDAAVTSDMQSVACSVAVYWSYDGDKILDIVNGYSDSSIKSLVGDNLLGSIKEVIGKYSIYDIVEKQDEVTQKVKIALDARLEKYPVLIRNLNINNWDWAPEFDKQISATMAIMQQSKIAQHELEVTKQTAQKQVAEANAAKQKAEIEAQMKVVVAQQEALAHEAEAQGYANAQKIQAEGEAEAKKILGNAEAAYYNSIKPYTETIKALKELEINNERAKHWNGVEVSTYLPLTANGTMVNLH